MNDGQSLLQNPALSEEMLLLLIKHPKHQHLVYKVYSHTFSKVMQSLRVFISAVNFQLCQFIHELAQSKLLLTSLSAVNGRLHQDQ